MDLNTESASNRRIARNTLFLYLRMAFSVVVNLYAVRVIWTVLGVDDYGIYNVVGGIVLMFQFLNSAMVASSQRYISYELGGGDAVRLTRVFGVSVRVHYLLALLILLLAETVGLWFLLCELHIPPGRMGAAMWVYQCSVLAFMVTVVSVPYNACIVAHESMKAYGYMGMLEVVLKLSIVFALLLLPGDKLIVYALLVLGVQLLMRVLYILYCRRNYAECRGRAGRDRGLMREMFAFAGWSFLGNMGFSVRDQGLNFMVNMFFSVAMNAAKGVANQISNVLSGFTASFQMAVNPQITKRYAAGERDSMLRLVFQGSKYSFLLLLLMVVPLWIAANQVLRLWLDEIPPYTVGFLRLVLLQALVESMVSPVTTALQATGRIKKFQILVSIIMLSNLPLAWLWLHFAHEPYAVVYVCIFTAAVALWMRLRLLRELMEFDVWGFASTVIAPSLASLAVAGVASWTLYELIGQGLWRLVAFAAASVGVTCAASCLLGLGKGERRTVLAIARAKLHV